MSTALLVYANGSEDLEITAPADILTRGGVKVIRAALTDSGTQVKLAHGTCVVCDINLNDVKGPFDAIVIPGGLPGSNHCRDSAKLTVLLKEQQAQDKIIAAICAAPGFVLQTHGLIGEKKATGYPGCENGIKNYTGNGVEVDDKLITGKGPGFAVQFGLTILEALEGKAAAEKVAAGMLID